MFRDQAPDLASVLAALPNLQDVALRQLRAHSVPLPASEYLLLMQQLASRQALTRLSVEGPMNTAGAKMLSDSQSRACGVYWTEKTIQNFRTVLQVVSSMSSLQHLELNIPEGISEDTLAQLTLPKLLSVHLEGLECSVTLQPQERSKNGINAAPALQHMSLCWQAPGHLLRAPGLGKFSKLQSLKLRSVTLVNNAADEPELLELLPALQQLSQLTLDSVLFQAPDLPVAAPRTCPHRATVGIQSG